MNFNETFPVVKRNPRNLHAWCVGIALCVMNSFATGGPLDETRVCGVPKRAADGKIYRRDDVRVAFAKLYACPATGEHKPSCPGWAIDHVIPLAVGGCDSVSNLQWLPLTLKACSGNCKDRWERKVYQP